jgi:hypothetical protein
MPFALDAALIVILAATAPAAFIVTVFPEAMMTSSPAAGTEAPVEPPNVADHVLVTFQFPAPPEGFEYRVAAIDPVAQNRLMMTIMRMYIAKVFISAPRECEKYR